MKLEGRGARVAGWGVAALVFVVLMLVTPKIPQSQKYHQFADRRNFFGEHLNVLAFVKNPNCRLLGSSTFSGIGMNRNRRVSEAVGEGFRQRECYPLLFRTSSDQ